MPLNLTAHVHACLFDHIRQGHENGIGDKSYRVDMPFDSPSCMFNFIIIFIINIIIIMETSNFIS